MCPTTLSTPSYYVLFNILANYTALSRAQLQSEVEVPVFFGDFPIRQLFRLFFLFFFLLPFRRTDLYRISKGTCAIA